MAEIGLAASIIAVIQIAASVTTQAYNYGVKFKNAKEDLEEVNRDLGHVAQVLDRLKTLAEEAERSGKALDTWPALVELRSDDSPLAKCNQALLDLRNELTPPDSLRQKLSQRAKWAWKKEKVEKSLQTIVKQKLAFLEPLSVDHMSQTIESGVIISGISEAQIKAMKNKIIQWLAPVDPRTNQEAARKKHEEQTGRWFTEGEQFSNWLEQPNSLLWLHGIPGSGKTILCSEIIEQTTEYCKIRDNHHLAYFFFSFRETDKQKVSNLPRSILAQLLEQNDNIPIMIKTFYEQYQHGVPSERGVMNSIRDLITKSQTYIIVDALDECPNTEDERAELCEILKAMHSWNCERLHILVTSRKEADLTESLLPIVTQEPIGIQGSVVDADIRKFVRTQLQVNSRLSKLSGELRAEIEQTLVKKSGGMFRWVECQFYSLSKCLSPSDIRIALSSLPRTLDETYERILVNMPMEYRTRAINALKWIIYRWKFSLYLGMLADATVINHEADPPFNLGDRLSDPSWLLEILPGLVTTSYYFGVQIAHFSVVEYLESARIVDGPANVFHFERSKAVISIIKDCFGILKSYAHPINQKLLGDNAGVFSPLEWYAWKYWADYVESLDTPIDPEISRLVVDFVVNIGSIQQRHHYNLKPTRWSRAFIKIPGGKPLDNGFYTACQRGTPNLARIFLDAGADFDFQKGQPGTALQIAAAENIPEIVQTNLLDLGADINSKAGKLGTGLQIAIIQGRLEIVKLLLDAGAKECTALGLAAMYNSPEMVRMLLDAGADINSQAGNEGTALQIAVAKGRFQIVKSLLETGADINLAGGEYGTALQAAAEHDKPEILQALLNAGADVNLQVKNGVTALQIAAFFGRLGAVELLLEAGADINLIGGMYGTALQAAAMSLSDRPEVARVLLDAGADINSQAGSGSTALQLAAGRGTLGMVKLLLEAGADINLIGGMYGTALQAAAMLRFDSPEVARVLLDAGADINSQAGNGSTALQLAAGCGHLEMVKLLLEAGADINLAGGNYGTALQAAATSFKPEIVRVLLDRGADMNSQAGRSGIALEIAAVEGRLETVKLLLEAGANINLTGGKYGTALHAAALKGMPEVVRILLNAGADINSQAGKLGTALQIAAEKKYDPGIGKLFDDVGFHMEANDKKYGFFITKPLRQAIRDNIPKVLRNLLDAEADISLEDRKGCTALQIAAAVGRLGIVKLLLEAGADINLSGEYGTALELARKCHRSRVVDILVNAGAK